MSDTIENADLPQQFGRSTSTTLSKAALLLRVVGSRFPSGGNLSNIAREAGINTATAHRLLVALSAEGLLAFDPHIKTYHVGFDLLQIAESALRAAPDLRLRQALRPLLSRVAAKTGEWTYLNVRSGTDALCIDRMEGHKPFDVNPVTAGRRRPLGVGAGGIALLSALPTAEADRLIRDNAERYERYSGIVSAEVRMYMERCRLEGYALNDGRITAEVVGVGVAVELPGHLPLAAISVAAMRSRMGTSHRQAIVDILKEEVSDFVSRSNIDERHSVESSGNSA